MKFLKDVIKLVGSDVAMLASEGTIADNVSYIDTGCYILNIVLSGSLRGGAPMNMVTGFAAAESVGKSFLVIQIIKHFLESDPKGVVIYNETEGRINKEMLEKRGVDVSRVIMLYPETIEQFKNVNYKIIDDYRNQPAKDRPTMVMVTDSLTQLPSAKELTDAGKDKEVGDMGLRAKMWRQAFRVLRQPLAKSRIPMFCTSHTYQSPGMFPTIEVAGGGGFKYAADIIAMITSSKDQDEKSKLVRGTVLTFKIAKGSGVVKQHSQFRAYLSFSSGLHKYFGLQDIALEAGIFEKGTQGLLIDGKKVMERQLLAEPTKYFTEEVLDKIEAFVKERYTFAGSGEADELSDIIGEDEE